MKRAPISALLLLSACLAGAPTASEPQPLDPLLAELGQPLYERHCASCHGLDGQGDGPAAGALRTPPADLTGIARRRDGAFPRGEIARFVDGRFALSAHGSRDMPVWGTRFGEAIPETDVAESITRGKIAALVEYLMSIQSDPGGR